MLDRQNRFWVACAIGATSQYSSWISELSHNGNQSGARIFLGWLKGKTANNRDSPTMFLLPKLISKCISSLLYLSSIRCWLYGVWWCKGRQGISCDSGARDFILQYTGGDHRLHSVLTSTQSRGQYFKGGDRCFATLRCFNLLWTLPNSLDSYQWKSVTSVLNPYYSKVI